MTDLNPKLHTPDGTSYNVKDFVDTEHLRRNGEDIDSEAPPAGGSGEANTSSNVGAGAGLAKAKVGVDLPFKSLLAGANITITPGTNEVTIAVSGLGALAALNTVGTAQIDNNSVSDAKLRDSAALSVIGRASNTSGDPADIAAASDHQVLRRSGTSIGFGAVNIASGSAVTGQLAIANGGHGGATAEAGVHNLITNCGSLSVFTDLGDEVVFSTGVTGKRITIENFLKDGIGQATNDTSPDRNVEFLARDGSGNLRAVLFDDMHPNGQNYVAEVIEYTGSGSSGKTVGLTGINRVHAFLVFDNRGSGNIGFMLAMPRGATGTINARFSDTGSNQTFFSLNAPAAGTLQTLTINTTSGAVNASGQNYRILAIGTPV